MFSCLNIQNLNQKQAGRGPFWVVPWTAQWTTGQFCHFWPWCSDIGLSESRDWISQDLCNCILFRWVFPGALPSLSCKLHLKLHMVTVAFLKKEQPLSDVLGRPCEVRSRKSRGTAPSSIHTMTPAKYSIKVQDPETVKCQPVQVSYF